MPNTEEHTTETADKAWFRKEALRQAEAACKDRLDGLNKTKDRASSLLGWGLSVTSAAVALFASDLGCAADHVETLIASGVLVAGMAAACVFCGSILMGTTWAPAWIYPASLEALALERGVQSEDEMQIAIADEISLRDMKNAQEHARLQKVLRRAWRISIATPFCSLLAVFLIQRFVPR